VALRNFIKDALVKNNFAGFVRRLVHVTESLATHLDPQHEPIIVATNLFWILFDKVAIGLY
jgi:hypothetical protein